MTRFARCRRGVALLLVRILACLSLGVSNVSAQELVFNEVLALNAEGLRDEDGEASDWIEIRNLSGREIDLGGWSLSDDPSLEDRWVLPRTLLAPGAYLLVFASGKNRAIAGGELHASFRISGDGEWIALLRPDALTVEDAIEVPPQREDVSYGRADGAAETLFGAGSAASYLVPHDNALGLAWTRADFDDRAWSGGPSGLGYDTSTDPGGELENVAPLGAASQSSDFSATFAAVRAIDGDRGNFTATASGDANAWWELDLGESRAVSSVTLFNRGDGCCQSRLRDITVTLRDAAGEEVFESELLNPENFLGRGTTAGPGHMELDIVAAAGDAVRARYLRVTRTSDPDLSGSGGVGNADEADVLSLGEVEVYAATGALDALIRTDLEADLRGIASSLLARFPFVLEDAAAVATLTARISYDDGFVAYLNGVEVARAAAPGAVGAPVAFDAEATLERGSEDGVGVAMLDLSDHVGALQEGENVLAVHGLNYTAGDVDFLVAVELHAGTAASGFLYFDRPTPGAVNHDAGFAGFVEDTRFSVDRGLYTEPFDVTITTATPGAVIRFTRDGRPPDELSGEVYEGPIHIEGTTVLRAMATRPGLRATNVDTHTYVFPEDVLEQPVLLPDIARSATHRPRILAALSRLPAVSLSLANPSIPTGPEVVTSIELILPDGTEGFQIDAGVRRVGGHSLGAYPKNNLRLYFRREHGASKLRYPLFEGLPYGEGAVEEFDRLNLRSGSHDSVFYLGDLQQPPSNAQYVRNRFLGDMQLEMGRDSLRGRFVHLYLNGVYWGHYHLMESPSAAHAADYLGGEKEEHEAVRRGQPIGSSAPAWTRIRAMLRDDWPEVQRWVDVPNLVDYMLLNFWAGNAWDWREGQNWAAEGPSLPDRGGYRFLCWDSDIILRRTDDSNVDKGGPDFLFQHLLQHEGFRLALADGIERHFFHGGILTPERAARVYRSRADEVEETLIAESARWRQSGRVWLPETQWRAERDRLLGDFFPRRTGIVLSQLRSRGWLLPVDAPRFRVDGRALPPSAMGQGGWIERGALLSMHGVVEEAFIDALRIDEESSASVHVPADDRLGDAWLDPDFTEGSEGETWRSGLNGIGFDTGTGYRDVIAIDVGAEMSAGDGSTSAYLRLPFEIESAEELSRIARLRLEVFFDDGFVAWINGVRVAEANAPSALAWNARATRGAEADLESPSEFVLEGGVEALQVGRNLLAIQGMNSSVSSGDFLVLPRLFSGERVPEPAGPEIAFTLDGRDPREPGTPRYAESFAVERSVRVRARVREDGIWSALSDATFAVDEGLRVTEIHYHPLSPEGPPLPPAADASFETDDFEFVELVNTGAEQVDLAGYSLAGAVRFEFASGAVPSLAPGEVLVVVRNLEAFASRYDLGAILVAGEYAGRLSDRGETLRLLGIAGETVLEIPYDDAWHPASDGQGPSLVIVDLRAEREAWALAASWRESEIVHGTPGRGESEEIAGGQLPSDLTQDGRVDISDAIGLLSYLFLGARSSLPCGDGTLDDAANRRLLDTNGDGASNLSDAIALLGYLFSGATPPVLGTDCVAIEGCPDVCQSP